MKSISKSTMSKSEARLLNFFFENSGGELYEKEIKDKVGVSAGSANSGLKNLSKKCFLLHRKVGRMNFYRFDRENSVVKQMKKAHTLSLPLISKLKDAAATAGLDVYLYGSAARGEDAENSDIDLLVIGNIEPSKLERLMMPIRKLSKKPIKTSLFKRIEWLSLAKKDPAFFERVEKDKIRVA